GSQRDMVVGSRTTKLGGTCVVNWGQRLLAVARRAPVPQAATILRTAEPRRHAKLLFRLFERALVQSVGFRGEEEFSDGARASRARLEQPDGRPHDARRILPRGDMFCGADAGYRRAEPFHGSDTITLADPVAKRGGDRGEVRLYHRQGVCGRVRRVRPG